MPAAWPKISSRPSPRWLTNPASPRLGRAKWPTSSRRSPEEAPARSMPCPLPCLRVAALGSAWKTACSMTLSPESRYWSRPALTWWRRRAWRLSGVYRVPSNSAAVNNLTEQVNQGMKTMDDPRWSDVNVVSSLLKSFFRKLPQPLFTGDLYPVFIEASKQEDPVQRMNTLKGLVNALPPINYATLK